jgi:hypothetical protein
MNPRAAAPIPSFQERIDPQWSGRPAFLNNCGIASISATVVVLSLGAIAPARKDALKCPGPTRPWLRGVTINREKTAAELIGRRWV